VGAGEIRYPAIDAERTKKMDSSHESSPDVRPLWIPENVVFDKLPVALQRAIKEIVDRAYDELVL
jgi:hypothetical protein